MKANVIFNNDDPVNDNGIKVVDVEFNNSEIIADMAADAGNGLNVGLVGGIGPQGSKGDSAYDVAKKNGFQGTQSEWLLSLKGQKGDPGQQGIQGIPGQKGDKGDKGQQGIQGIRGDKGQKGDKGDKGEKGDKGQQGIQGIQGIQGQPGLKGDTGSQITRVYSDEEGRIVFNFNNDSIFITNSLIGPRGPQGQRGQDGFSPYITSVPITGGNQITFHTGIGDHVYNILNGQQGQQGQNGISATISVINISGGHRLTITDKNGTNIFDVMDGHTPIKGVDYWTEQDRQDIINDILEALAETEG